MRAFFEPQLEGSGLSMKQIESQTAEECEISLRNVNDAIQKPEAFGTVQLNFQGQQGIIPGLSTPDGQVTVGALPVLLERKSMILRRLGALSPQKELVDLEKIASKVEDLEARESLLKEIKNSKDKVVAQTMALTLEAEETDTAFERSMRMQVEVKERTSAMRRAWFERESVAGFVGALLLLSLGAAVIVSMFTHTTAPEIVTSSFLLILGYFFGQAGSERQRRKKPKEPKSQPSIQVK